MIGWDFSNFWNVGRAILAGGNPFAVDYSWYPPAAAIFFALFGLLPFSTSFLVWTAGNIFFYFHTLWRLKLGRQWWAWLLFTPFLFTLLSGQLDIFLFWTASFLFISPNRNKAIDQWIPALAGAFLTIKPQLAAVVLPWFLIQWWHHDRQLLLKWFFAVALLHLLPLLYNPEIYGLWVQALQGVGEKKAEMSGGLFAFGTIGVPGWLLWATGGCLMIWGIFQKEPVSRSAQLTGFPISAWYDMVILVGSAPVKLMVPISWLTLVVSYISKSNLPMVGIPFITLVWLVFSKYNVRKRKT